MSTSDQEVQAAAVAPEPSGRVEPAEDQPATPGIGQFVHHLHFEHLRNLTTLSVSATGGGLLAFQAGLLDLGPATAVPLGSFALAAVLSLLTQRTLIRDLGGMAALRVPRLRPTSAGTTGGPAPSQAFVVMSEVSAMLFGAGVGSAAVILLAERFL